MYLKFLLLRAQLISGEAVIEEVTVSLLCLNGDFVLNF